MAHSVAARSHASLQIRQSFSRGHGGSSHVKLLHILAEFEKQAAASLQAAGFEPDGVYL